MLDPEATAMALEKNDGFKKLNVFLVDVSYF